MSQRADRMKALEYGYPDRIPVNVNFLPATWKKYREELTSIVDKYPRVFEPNQLKTDYDSIEGKFVKGRHVDVWGCVWSNVAEGLDAIVTDHPVPTREDVHNLQVPAEDAGLPHGFMYLRLLDLRGFEEAMIDFAEEPPELTLLIKKVLEYNMRQLHLLLARRPDVRLLGFGDDLGMQHSLPISPEKWRKYLKPCYAKIYKECRDAGYYVYMHTDGHIFEIIPDLIECGVNVLNPQVGANGLDNLAHVCKGKVCVDLDLDRQMFPFCTPRDIRDHVREAVEKLGSPAGGLWLRAECGPDVPLVNIEGICEALEEYSTYFG